MGDTVLQLLKDEFADGMVGMKRRAAGKLDLVAKALGPDKVKSELIPWLLENSNQEDEILYILAQKCKVIAETIKGEDFAVALLPFLENLMQVEETVVRESAVNCMRTINDDLKSEQAKQKLVDLMVKLASDEWFTARVSACALCGILMPSGMNSDQLKRIKEVYATLCNDETPMVRRAAARELPEVLKGLKNEEVIDDVLQLYNKLSVDPQESVALHWIDNLSSIIKKLPQDLNAEHLLSRIKRNCKDRSWRVRFTIGKSFDKICEGLSAEIVQNELLDIFCELLRDPEGEVRSVTSEHIVTVCQVVGSEAFVQKVIPVIKSLVEFDQLRAVRVNFAKATTNERVLKIVGPEVSRSDFAPLWESLLRDASCQCAPEVRLIVLDKLNEIVKALGAGFVAQTWTGALQQLFDSSRIHSGGQSDESMGMGNDTIEHPQWRLRVALLKSLVNLSGSGESAMDKLVSGIWQSCLVDDVFQVRLVAAQILKEFCDPSNKVGTAQVTNTFIPRLLEYFKQAKTKNHHRTIFLHAFAAILEAEPSLAVQLFPAYEKCLDDRIPNVRLTAISVVEQVTDETFKNKFSGQLKALINDPDPDVSAQAKLIVANMNL